MYDWFTEGFDPADLQDAKVVLDELAEREADNMSLQLTAVPLRSTVATEAGRENYSGGSTMVEIDVGELTINAVDLWMHRWLLLTAGTLDSCNMMPVAFGSIGCMWSKPIAQVAVRPQRSTYFFLEQSDSFTLCAFPEEYRKDLEILGSLSAKDGDKLGKTQLTLKASKVVSAPSYHEADLILECKKIYYHDIAPEGMVASTIHDNYTSQDYHRVYFGEIMATFLGN